MRNHEDQESFPWRIKQNSVAVIGDLILDEYLHGNVDRISPEAPVPVHRVSSTIHTPGGAANVARNIHLVGGNVFLYGVLGKDVAGHEMLSVLQKDGLNTKNIIQTEEKQTIKKTRVTAGSQQIVRIDWEKVTDVTEKHRLEILDNLFSKSFSVILLSDYAKGMLGNEFCSQVIQKAKQKGIKIIVDPKGNNYERYRGAYLVTPNKKEACEALGLDPSEEHDPRKLCKEISHMFGIENVLVTLGAGGMHLYSSTEKNQKDQDVHLKSRARRVYDVSGAGDTVVALMALGIANDCSLEWSAKVANIGAGIVVEKWGTQPVLRDELIQELKHETELSQTSFTRKYLSLEEFVRRFGDKSKRDGLLVFTNGCFDILHSGHVAYLEACKKLGSVLVVAVNSDESVGRLKSKNRPIVNLENRLRVLAGLEAVDYLISFDEDTPLEVIQKINPNILVKASDYKIEDIVGGDWVKKNGGEVRTVSFLDGNSSSSIIEKIRKS